MLNMSNQTMFSKYFNKFLFSSFSRIIREIDIIIIAFFGTIMIPEIKTDKTAKIS